MSIGAMRHRVTIQRLTQVQDEAGQVQDQWVDVATVWAAIEGLGGREYWAAQQTVSHADHRITIRWRPDVTAAMRVVHGTRAFDVQAVIDDGRRRWLELLASLRE